MRGWVAPFIKLIAFLIVTTLATYVLAATISNASYGSVNKYSADFTDVTGLNLNDDVRIAGVRVGSIVGIKVVKRNLAEVKFTVAADHRIPKSVLARLRYRNLVGQRYLELAQGAGDANDLLPPNGNIPEKQTENALDLTQLFGGFQPLFQVLNGTELNQLSASIIGAFQGEGPSIELLVQQVGSLTTALASKDQAIGSLIDNLNSVLTAVNDRDAELTDLINSLQTWVSGLAEDRQSIGNAIDGVNGLATTATQLLTSIRPPLAADVTQLKGLATTLNKNSSTITTTIQQVPARAAALIRTMSYGAWANFYVCSLAGATTGSGGTLNEPNDWTSSQPRCSP
ncbi:phospholipid/cholesterol/gamma-HCH transport system substrate-binding protein [Jatrophihabitans sp. GAS493]|uniref:MCE family protein n=1 Tax=Jatrophihabitans sp. GAS493 TaxID=1907575 RepID=UPI000BB72E40|nr:MlaD family protein [Jatrophihabitans sp. GAS493]SOD72374.1 phospholipid/cholesterol/gamma-HCH transport system substrate-binding protein [Jatrophihabitans sp. GAS493]